MSGLAAEQVPPLAMILAEVVDRRRGQGRRHRLEAMLGLAVIALLCGYRTVGAIAEWGPNHGGAFQERLGFGRHGWPGRSTWYRVLAGIDIGDLEHKLGQWVQRLAANWPATGEATRGIALDGKTLRGSRRQGALDWHILGAVVHELGLTLGQVGVDEKTNEIGVVEQLLSSLDLSGRVVTTDALLTQKAVARQIVQAHGDYVLPVKDNHLALRLSIDAHFKRHGADTRFESTEKAHGRVTVRTIETSSRLNDVLDWPAVAQVFRLTRTTRSARGRPTVVVGYGITSLDAAVASPARLLQFVRGHWTIENRSHWVRDVDFDEDRSQIRSGHAHQVMAALRNAAIALIRRDGSRPIASALRHFAAQPALPVRLVLTG